MVVTSTIGLRTVYTVTYSHVCLGANIIYLFWCIAVLRDAVDVMLLRKILLCYSVSPLSSHFVYVSYVTVKHKLNVNCNGGFLLSRIAALNGL